MEQAQLLEPAVQKLAAQENPYDRAIRDLSQGDDWLSAVQYWDLQCYLPLDILPKVDRMTMAHSLESRPALLDHRLVEFAASIPSRFRLRGSTTKYLFKQAMRGVLPEIVVDRPKLGFTLPFARWFRGDWSEFVQDLLLSPACRRRGLFRPDYIAMLLRLHSGGRDLSVQLWALASIELWCRMFLDADGRGRVVARLDRETPLGVGAAANV
jgi:asparagine synthase (glutamine-hydrolysing)